jgi:hypothetical protein
VALLGGHEKIVELLLSKGADVKTASFKSHRKIVGQLLSKRR